MRILAIIALIAYLMSPLGTYPQASIPTWSLKFEEFPEQIYQGKSARPILASKTQRTYRTVIRSAARNGPDFAGHFAIAHWGRGSGITSFVVVDVTNGRVFENTPFPFIDVPFQGASNGRDYQGLIFKSDSRLLIADGCFPKRSKCGTYYYEWKDNTFTLLKFDLVERSKT